MMSNELPWSIRVLLTVRFPTFTEITRASQWGYLIPYESSVENDNGTQCLGASSGVVVKHTDAAAFPEEVDPGSPIMGMASIKLIGSSSSESCALFGVWWLWCCGAFVVFSLDSCGFTQSRSFSFQTNSSTWSLRSRHLLVSWP